MKILGSVTVQTTEEADRLSFSVTWHRGWLEFLVIPIIASPILSLFWRAHKAIAIVVAALILVPYLAYRMKSTHARLVVSSSDLTVTGDLQNSSVTKISIPALSVKCMGFFIGEEGQPAGLYVQHGLQNTAILPNLNRDQAESIATKIRQHYPDLEQGDRAPLSLVSSGDGDPTVLGMSAYALPEQDTESNTNPSSQAK